MHLVLNDTNWNFYETIKQRLPVWVTQLMDLGAEFPRIEQSRFSRKLQNNLGYLMTRIIDVAEGNSLSLIENESSIGTFTHLSYTVSGCNNISLAILRKSEIDLRQALTISQSSINKTNNTGQSALHLAVEWPRGMDLLLQAGANVDCKDDWDQSPLVYAVWLSLVEPMELLAHTDCSLLNAHAQLLLENAVDIETSDHLNRRQVTAAEMVVNLIVDMVVDRRQRLYDLATSALPVSDLDRLCHDSYLPDESASQLYLTLLRHGTTVPLALDPGENRGTVFHQIGVSTRVAERLWKAGFRSIDGRDPFGLTPLMCVRNPNIPYLDKIDFMLEYVAWLVEKGADFYAKQDMTLYWEHMGVEYRSESQTLSATALHFVSYDLGSTLGWYPWKRLRNWVEKRLSEPSKEMLQRILMDNDSDVCMCACSISGCTTFTVFTKSYVRKREGLQWEKVSSVDLWPIVKDFSDPLKISELLRIMTFKELALTHTCCCKLGYPCHWVIKDKAEIDEIRNEEAEDLQKLEELLEEFEAKRNELDIPFEDFINEYWGPRMKEVLEEGTLDEDALREIGVEVY